MKSAFSKRAFLTTVFKTLTILPSFSTTIIKEVSEKEFIEIIKKLKSENYFFFLHGNVIVLGDFFNSMEEEIVRGSMVSEILPEFGDVILAIIGKKFFTISSYKRGL